MEIRLGIKIQKECRKCGDSFAKNKFYLEKHDKHRFQAYHLSCLERYPHIIDYNFDSFKRAIARRENKHSQNFGFINPSQEDKMLKDIKKNFTLFINSKKPLVDNELARSAKL